MTEHEHKCPSCGSKAAAGIGFFKREECLRKSYQKACDKMRDMLRHTSVIIDDIEFWVDEHNLYWDTGNNEHSIPLDNVRQLFHAIKDHEELNHEV